MTSHLRHYFHYTVLIFLNRLQIAAKTDLHCETFRVNDISVYEFPPNGTCIFFYFPKAKTIFCRMGSFLWWTNIKSAFPNRFSSLKKIIIKIECGRKIRILYARASVLSEWYRSYETLFARAVHTVLSKQIKNDTFPDRLLILGIILIWKNWHSYFPTREKTNLLEFLDNNQTFILCLSSQ